MDMSMQILREAASDAGLDVEAAQVESDRAVFWQRIDGALSRRITRQSKANPVDDVDISWVQGFEQRCKEVKRTLMQRLRKVEIPNVIYGIDGKEFEPDGEKESNYLLWANNADVELEQEVRRRIAAEADLEMLGSSLAIVRNGIPQGAEADHRNYMPSENPLVSVEQAKREIETGINNTFTRMLKSDLGSKDTGVDDLNELEQFWSHDVGFATLQGGSITSLSTRRGMPKAWIVIIPHGHEFLQTGPAPLYVDVAHDMNLLYVKPIACTQQWYGVAGPHELTHLHDFATGKEPKKPSRQEYIDGEHRAFSAEIVAADINTNGEFSRAISEFAEHSGLTMEEIMNLSTAPQEQLFDRLGATLDSHIKIPSAKSFSESNMRLGLYFMACAFAVAAKEATHAENEEILRKRVIESIYGRQKLLPAK